MKEENQAVIKALNMYGRVPKMWELLEEIEKLHSIIKEVREHCNLHLKTANEVIVESEKWLEVEEQAEFAKRDIHTAKVVKRNMEDILEILDKENI